MDAILMRQDSWARFLHHTYVIKYCFLLCCMTHFKTNEFDLKLFSSQTLNNIVPFLCFRCAPGFLGKYCQHKDPCYVGYCLNGGECTVSVDGVPGSPSCVCPLGFTGQRCEIQKNSTCFPNNPCTNGGKCSLLPNNQYKCQCARGWTGQISLSLPISVCPSVTFWKNKNKKHYFSKVLNSHSDSFVIVFVLLLTFSPQVSIVSKRTHVCPARVPTVVSAWLCPIVNSLVPVLLVTMAPVVSMTQMSVPSPRLCARTKAFVWIPQAHIDVTANPALPASTARRITCPAFHPPASMVEPAGRRQTQLIYATACQVSSLGEEIEIYFYHSKKSYICSDATETC